MAPTFAIHTMGCKLNFYDSEAIAAGLEARGLEIRGQTRVLNRDIEETKPTPQYL